MVVSDTVNTQNLDTGDRDSHGGLEDGKGNSWLS